jgi:predicted ATP-grasp superfamily ATP-dependent carboligase
MRFATAQPDPPVLFYQSDSQLRLVSQHRERLAQAFRFVAADPILVEILVDKAKFQELAERLNLPVPAARRIQPSDNNAAEIDLHFPLIIKPVRHSGADGVSWKSIAGLRKALLVETAEALGDLWPHLVVANLDLLVQEAIPGPESRVESYHVYVDQLGTIVAEFTGRKIRTHPVTCGQSTALETTDASDVRALGREIVQRLDLRGVAKFDFKRSPEGMLYLLEINPRFNLWHHLGAVAGVNLPALVYADLVGLPRPTDLIARAGVSWGKLWVDVHPARASGIPATTWLLWAFRCDAKSAIALDDPMPLLRGALAKLPLPRWRFWHSSLQLHANGVRARGRRTPV